MSTGRQLIARFEVCVYNNGNVETKLVEGKIEDSIGMDIGDTMESDIDSRYEAEPVIVVNSKHSKNPYTVINLNEITDRTGKLIYLIMLLRKNCLYDIEKGNIGTSTFMEIMKQKIKEAGRLYENSYDDMYKSLISSFRTHDNKFMTIEYLSHTLYDYLKTSDYDNIKTVMMNSIDKLKNKNDFNVIHLFFGNEQDIRLVIPDIHKRMEGKR